MPDVLIDWFWIMNLARLVIIVGIPLLAIRATKSMTLTGFQAAFAVIIGIGIFYIELLFAEEIDGPELPNGQKWLMPYLAIAIPISILACAWTGWRKNLRKNKTDNQVA